LGLLGLGFIKIKSINVFLLNKLIEKSVRKIKLQIQISVDGLIAGPNGEMD
jgi:hypothetical protein